MVVNGLCPCGLSEVVPANVSKVLRARRNLFLARPAPAMPLIREGKPRIRRCASTPLPLPPTVPPAAACYWVGEAMNKTDFKDLPKIPDPVQSTAALLASSTAHLARLLNSSAFPGVDG